MATLNFTKQANGFWGADVTANENFVIQLERSKAGRIFISASQDSTMGKEIFFAENRGKSFRQSFSDLVFPLYPHIDSESEVTNGIFLER